MTQRFIPGTVTEVVSEELIDSFYVKGREIGNQELIVHLWDGRDIHVNNYINDTYNVIAKKGTNLIICVDEPGGDIQPYYRFTALTEFFP